MRRVNDGTSPVEFRRIKLARGVSSVALSRIVLGVFAVFLAAGVGVIVEAVTRPSNSSDTWMFVFFGSLSVWVASTFLMILLMLAVNLRTHAELRVGYTYASQTNMNAAQLDPQSGVVIREPGEPLLDSAELKTRKLAARQWARDERARRAMAEG